MQALISWSVAADRTFVTASLAVDGDHPEAGPIWLVWLDVARSLCVSRDIPVATFTDSRRHAGNGFYVLVDLPDDTDVLDSLVVNALPAEVVSWAGESGCCALLAGLSEFRTQAVALTYRRNAVNAFLASLPEACP